MGKDFIEVSGNGIIILDNLGFFIFGILWGEEEGDGWGDIFNEVRVGFIEDCVEVGGNGIMMFDDFR